MSTNTILVQNTITGVWNKVSGILVRLLQIPLLISALGITEYGIWLVLSSLPLWFKLMNLGFGNVAANEMTIAMASDDVIKAKEVFSTTLCLLAIIGITGSLIITVIAPFISWESFLRVSKSRHNELTTTIIWLSCTMFMQFFYDASFGRFRAARKAHMSSFVQSFLAWSDLLFIYIVIQFSLELQYIALALLLSTTMCCFIYQWLSWKSMPEIEFSFKYIQPKRFSILFNKGIFFQALPLGNAVLFQGNIMIVQAVLGPMAVTVFSTARMLVRTVNQSMELVNQIIWPEMSYSYGRNDLASMRRLHRLGVVVSTMLSIFGIVALILFGEDLVKHWLNGSVQIPLNLLILFIIPIPFNTFWFTSSVVHLAINKHEGLAIRYLLGAVISSIFCVLLSFTYGIKGAALSTLILDLIVIPYVIKNSLTWTEDSAIDFVKGSIDELKFTLTKIGHIRNFKLRTNKNI